MFAHGKVDKADMVSNSISRVTMKSVALYERNDEILAEKRIVQSFYSLSS